MWLQCSHRTNRSESKVRRYSNGEHMTSRNTLMYVHFGNCRLSTSAYVCRRKRISWCHNYQPWASMSRLHTLRSIGIFSLRESLSLFPLWGSDRCGSVEAAAEWLLSGGSAVGSDTVFASHPTSFRHPKTAASISKLHMTAQTPHDVQLSTCQHRLLISHSHLPPPPKFVHRA